MQLACCKRSGTTGYEEGSGPARVWNKDGRVGRPDGPTNKVAKTVAQSSNESRGLAKRRE